MYLLQNPLLSVISSFKKHLCRTLYLFVHIDNWLCTHFKADQPIPGIQYTEIASKVFVYDNGTLAPHQS